MRYRAVPAQPEAAKVFDDVLAGLHTHKRVGRAVIAGAEAAEVGPSAAAREGRAARTLEAAGVPRHAASSISSSARRRSASAGVALRRRSASSRRISSRRIS